MINKHFVSALLLGAALVFAPWAASSPAVAMTDEVGSYLGPEPTLFDTPEAAIAAFKDAMAKGDINAISTLLLGLTVALLTLSRSHKQSVQELIRMHPSS